MKQGKYSRKGGKEDSDSEDHDEREESDEIDHSSEASEAESDDESPELECSRGLKAIESNKKHPPRPLDEDEEPETPLYLRIQKNLIDNERNAHQNTRVRKIKREKSRFPFL